MSKLLFVITILLIFSKNFNAFAALCTFPSTSKTQTVSSTIYVKQNTDFGNTKFVGGSGILNGACSVNNGKMKNIMLLANGVTIKNAIFDTPGMGVWCEGSCTLQNIYFQNLCYRAAAFAYSDASAYYTYNVIGGAAKGSPDKFFTQSGRGKTTISGFCGEGEFGKVYCSCGNCQKQMQRSVEIKNTKLQGPALSIASVNVNYGDTASFSNIQLYGQKSSSTYIKYACQEYNGLTYSASMSPTSKFKVTQDGTGKSCKYSASSIKIVN